MTTRHQHAPDPNDVLGGPMPERASGVVKPTPANPTLADSSGQAAEQRNGHDWTRDHERGLMGQGSL